MDLEDPIHATSSADEASAELDGFQTPSNGAGTAQQQPEIEEVVDGTSSSENDEEPTQNGQDGLRKGPLLQPRSYQLEMLEKSLETNIIVAMDTGSGKTHIATLRIAAELERCDPEAYVWFLAPTVALCEQQYNVLSLQLPSVQIRFLSGADKPELWRDQSLWDAVLQNIRVVVSTHAVLLDALSNGFVQLHSLALLVFDEAHHCVGNHPANRIMNDFYHIALRKGDKKIPHILGLSASPVIKSKPQSLQKIEQNLNALSKSPKIHYEELLSHTHRPTLQKLEFAPGLDSAESSPTLARLLAVFNGLDIMQDPYVIELQNKTDRRSRQRLAEAISKRDTYCQKQMKALCNRSQHIQTELGTWATELYIWSVIDKLRASIRANDERLIDWSSREQDYLLGVLAQVKPAPPNKEPRTAAEMDISDKTQRLLDLLRAEHSDGFTGLIFVQQRAAVGMLAHLISTHPYTKHRFRCGTFVGTSSNSQRKSRDIAELLDPKSQKSCLDDLRERKINLVIATSVLEEGIDVSACHIVICFTRPANLKSFVQSRGRARRMQSKFVIMVEEGDSAARTMDWESLEEEMKNAYMDDLRALELQELGDESETYENRFEISSTGALLTPDNAMQHLYHFCAVMPADQYVDLRPEFTIEEVDSGFSATLILPNSVPAKVRRARSRLSWKSKRVAKKDAAFEAFIALYNEGLVNDHLLPLHRRDDVYRTLEAVEEGPSVFEVSALFNPWVEISRSWRDTTTVHFTSISIRDEDGRVLSELAMGLPVKPPVPPVFSVYWDKNSRWSVSSRTTTSDARDARCEDYLFESTELLLKSVFRHRMKVEERDFVASFTPTTSGGQSHLQTTLSKGCWRALDVYDNHADMAAGYGMVRHITQNGAAHVFKRWLIREVESEVVPASNGEMIYTEKLHVEATRWPRRSDLLHPATEDAHAKSRVHYLLADDCEIDKLPLRYAQFATCIPSILHRFEVYLIADQLRNTILGPAEFQDLDAVVTAISASSACEQANYQRMEFLGDSILKLCTSVQLLGEHVNWHEGYLSAHKDRLVSNPRLAKAAQDIGLDAYVLTEPFRGRKWRPLYRSDLLQSEEIQPRKISRKVLADVVEAVIGAAFLEGGLSKALVCMRIFLPELEWASVGERYRQLYDLVPDDVSSPSYMQELEDLVGHRFSKKALLLEAMTHPSYQVETTLVSYQRLEFLGDSVLDQIVVTKLYDAQPAFPHDEMHLMRSALVNADFLAFLCMETSTWQSRIDIQHRAERGAWVSFEKCNTSVEHHLWQFMRHTTSEIARAQKECVERYNALRKTIRFALDEGLAYPWVALSRLRADKFFSDLIESVLGAIYIDSFGDLQPCVSFLDKIGLTRYLNRIVTSGSTAMDGAGDKIHLMHPKQELGIAAAKTLKKVRYVISKDGDGDDVIQARSEHNDNGDGEGQRTGTIHSELPHQQAPKNKEGKNGKGLYRCQVFVGDEVMATARKSGSKVEAMTIAAAEALEKLRRSTSAEVRAPDISQGLLRDVSRDEGMSPEGQAGKRKRSASPVGA